MFSQWDFVSILRSGGRKFTFHGKKRAIVPRLQWATQAVAEASNVPAPTPAAASVRARPRAVIGSALLYSAPQILWRLLGLGQGTAHGRCHEPCTHIKHGRERLKKSALTRSSDIFRMVFRGVHRAPSVL
jgi:hypothetical protein